MKRLVTLFVAFAVSLALLGGAAFATPVEFTNGTAVVPALNLSTNSEDELFLQSFHLLGKNPDGSYLVYSEQNLYTVLGTELGKVFSIPDDLPTMGTTKALVRGNGGAAVLEMQRALQALDYLTISPDGDYGPGTEKSVAAFQAATGLEATGQADEITQLLIASMNEETVYAEAILDPEVIYKPILGRTNVNLQPIMDSGLILSYDDIKGEGFMTDRNGTQVDVSGKSDLDKYTLTVRLGFLAKENEGVVEVSPAIKVSCVCVRRPVMSGAIVKAGAARAEGAIEGLTISLDGVYTVEEGVIPLTEQMVDVVAGASEAGELKMRIEGQYHSFDVSLDNLSAADLLSKLAKEIQE